MNIGIGSNFRRYLAHTARQICHPISGRNNYIINITIEQIYVNDFWKKRIYVSGLEYLSNSSHWKRGNFYYERTIRYVLDTHAILVLEEFLLPAKIALLASMEMVEVY